MHLRSRKISHLLVGTLAVVTLSVQPISLAAQEVGGSEESGSRGEPESPASRLNSDLETGRIDVDEWTRLGIASVLTPEAVPARYRPERSSEGGVTGEVVYYLSRWNEVSESTRTVVDHAFVLLDTWRRDEAGKLLVDGEVPSVAEQRAALGEMSFDPLSVSSARLSEIATAYSGSPPDSQSKEYVEVQGPPNEDLSSLSIVVIDGSPGSAGEVAAVFNLGTTDSLGVWWTGFQTDSIPDVDVTVLLVDGQAPNQGVDLDTDDDGYLDSPPWSDVLGIGTDSPEAARAQTETSIRSPGRTEHKICAGDVRRATSA